MRDYDRPGRWTRWHVAAVVLLLAVFMGSILLIYRLTDSGRAGAMPTEVAAGSTPAHPTSASPAASSEASSTAQATPGFPAATQVPVRIPSSPPPGATSAPSPPAPTPPPPTVVMPERLRAMTITDRLRVRSAPGVGADSIRYEPPLPKGTEFQIAGGPVYVSEYWWYSVRSISAQLEGDVDAGWVASADHDGTPWIGAALDACLDFEFPTGTVSVEAFDELESNMVGTWAGCATTPWTPPYWVTLDFRQDGTYSSYAEVAPDDVQYPALYYGTDEDSPDKQYELLMFSSGLGSGEIDIAFDVGTVNRGELWNIAMMGDRMEFQFSYGGAGPVGYRLYRQR